MDQALDGGYEVLVVDDGSTDGTAGYLRELAAAGRLRCVVQENRGIAPSRNVGVREARGELIVFVDSDVVVTPTFLAEHLAAHLAAAPTEIICQGSPILTSNFDDPTSEPFNPLTDASRAEFDTCNVSVRRDAIARAGWFDEDFAQYGWEDLELGIRLKRLGLKVARRPRALGFHYHPPFRLDMLPGMVQKEIARGKGAVRFYRKHPTLAVRLMTQLTPLHRALDWLLTWGGRLNERNMRPVLAWLDRRGYQKACIALARVLVNQYNMRAMRERRKEEG